MYKESKKNFHCLFASVCSSSGSLRLQLQRRPALNGRASRTTLNSESHIIFKIHSKSHTITQPHCLNYLKYSLGLESMHITTQLQDLKFRLSLTNCSSLFLIYTKTRPPFQKLTVCVYIQYHFKILRIIARPAPFFLKTRPLADSCEAVHDVKSSSTQQNERALVQEGTRHF